MEHKNRVGILKEVGKLGGIFLLFLSINVAKGQDVKVEDGDTVRYFSLQQAKEYALQNSYQVQYSLQDIEIAKKQVLEQMSKGLPNITATAGLNHNLLQPQFVISGGKPFTMGMKNSLSGGVELTQLIFDASYIVGLQASKVFKQTAEIQREKTEALTIESVITAYGSILIAKENVALLMENIENTERVYKENQASYEAGVMEEEDALQMKILLGNIKTELDNARRQEIISKNLLKFVLGIPVSDRIEIKDSLSSLIEKEIVKNSYHVTEFDPLGTVDYRISEYDILSKKLLYKNEMMSLLPKISGVLNYKYQSMFESGKDKINFGTSVIGIQLSWTLFDGLGRYSKISQAKLSYQKSLIQGTEVTEKLTMDWERALSQFDFAKDQLLTQKSNLELSRRIRDKVQIKYSVGMSSSFELTDAINQLLSTQMNYMNAIYTLLQRKAELDQMSYSR